MSSYKSRHVGLDFSITDNFHSRFHFFICFSRNIAASTSPVAGIKGGGYAASAGFNAASGVPSFQGSGTS